jgi:hypothetical protein
VRAHVATGARTQRNAITARGYNMNGRIHPVPFAKVGI